MVISFKLIKKLWGKVFGAPDPSINCAHDYESDPDHLSYQHLIFLKCVKCGKKKNTLQ